jgi:E3 ubiquitin-protein ligase HERC2
VQDFKKRHLIFDALGKIISRRFGRSSKSSAFSGESRGTYLYTWGAGYHGQLGRKFGRGTKKYATVPRLIEIGVPVRQIACGGLHTAAVTDAGTVYTWGDARALQLGYQPNGFTNQSTPFPVQSLDHSFVSQVACGQSHTLALTDKGTLYSWGLSKSGQGGHGDRQTIRTPKEIALKERVQFIDISCGDRHSVALTSQGKVYAWGCGEHGQLGHGNDDEQSRPTVVQALAHVRIASVVCGSIHTCFVSEAGQFNRQT